ncbi:hypothetical protein ACT2CV_02315 [Pasteurellaceae bacterium 22721_9_1]
MTIYVSNISELQTALSSSDKEIVLKHSIIIPNELHLPNGFSLNADPADHILIGFGNGGGLKLTGNNTVSNIAIQTTPTERAIYIDSSEVDLGKIALENLTVTGQVQLLLRRPNSKLDLYVNNLDIVASDSRNRSEKPLKYGVVVHQGAFTLYNYNSDKDSLVTATIENIRIGRKNAPVLGSGVFIGGFNDDGGKVIVEKLVTDEIYSNGMIPFGQPNIITGGIFILSGAHAKEIDSKGTVTTYGVNDMVLDVWGSVDNWVCHKEITSYGTSGIGFVNFGIVKNFDAKAPIRTFGSGARAFNQYDGTIERARFHSLTTFGDGSIGIQVSKPVGTIHIKHDIQTNGSVGESLVKGQIMTLAATGLSIQEGGEIQSLVVGGNIETKGDKVTTLEINKGKLLKCQIDGTIQALGENAKTLNVTAESLDKKILTELESKIA